MLTCTVDEEEGWLFEATRTLLDHLGDRTLDDQIAALLAEGYGTLLAQLPRGAVEEHDLCAATTARQRWREELMRRRAEAEARREKSRVPGNPAGGTDSEPPTAAPIALEAAMGGAQLAAASARELDELVRRVSAALARHELELCQRVLQLHRAGGWRALGYASEAQFARERLGMSRSSLLGRRCLASKLEALPAIAEAIGRGQLGVEAALQVARIATPTTEAAWVHQARRRTLKHLREEVAAALVAVRVSGEVDCPPPSNAELEAFHDLERAVVGGRIWESLRRGGGGVGHERPPRDGEEVPPEGSAAVAGEQPLKDEVSDRESPKHNESRRSGIAPGFSTPNDPLSQAWPTALQSLASWLEGGLQTSAAQRRYGSPVVRHCKHQGRSQLRLWVSRETYDAWHALEMRARGWLPRGMTWIRFLCLSLWGAWGHVVCVDTPYRSVYVRDRWRCMSPVCNRRDVTPHHILFRSRGGSDAAHNVIALCTWCHLFGVHGGVIRAEGTANAMSWEIGPRGGPSVTVRARERVESACQA